MYFYKALTKHLFVYPKPKGEKKKLEVYLVGMQSELRN